MLYSKQDKNRLLVTAGFVKNRGDFHPTLDRPAEPVFLCKTLTLRWELIAEDAAVEVTNETQALFSSGKVRAVIYLPSVEIEGRKLAWEKGEESTTHEGIKTKKVWMEAVLWKGVAKDFDLRKLAPTRLGTGVELLEENQKMSDAGFKTTDSKLTWGNLELPWIAEMSDVDLAEKS
jgi:hypothetical protein